MGIAARRTLVGGSLAIAIACAGSASAGDRPEVAGTARLEPNVPARSAAGEAGPRGSAPAQVPPPEIAPGGGAGRAGLLYCAGCGVVDSMRRIENGGKAIYHMVVRLRDGSRHVFDEAAPRTLRIGERVRVIAGPGSSP